MTDPMRRSLLAGAAAAATLAATPSKERGPERGPGPIRDAGMRFSFNDAHSRLEEGGWAREVTARELPVAKEIAGVNMRLTAGGVRGMHWHKQAEWAYVLHGHARMTMVDQDGRAVAGDVAEGDLWYVPGGLPHSIQGLEPDGCEVLMVVPDGTFSDGATFLLTDWFAHVPRAVLAKNFGAPEAAFAKMPETAPYIFQSDLPAKLPAGRIASPQGFAPQSFTHRMAAQPPQRTPWGTVRITDRTNFAISTEIAAALVEIAPGGLRELHWHPYSDEWQCWLSGQGRMGIFASGGVACTVDLRAGDVGYVGKTSGHWIENTGTGTLRYLELFASGRYTHVSAGQCLALSPPELVRAHLRLAPETMAALGATEPPVSG